MMTYDGLVLAAVVAELKRTVETGRIQHIRQHDDSDLTFEVRSRNESYLLFMSVSARFSRVHLSSGKPPTPQTPPNFCMLLRKYLGGAFIRSVEQSGFDRVLKINTQAPDGNRNTLVLELMGKHSNLILLSDTDKILGAAKHVSAAVSRYRQVLPGRDYIPPPGGSKLDPLSCSRAEYDALWRDGIGTEATEDNVKRGLVAGFSGIGPFLAEEIMLRAGSPTPDAVWNALENIRVMVGTREFAPMLITNERGSSIYAYPMPTRQHPEKLQHPRSSMNEVLDTLYRDLTRRDAFDTEYASLETAIKRSIAARRQTLKGLETSVVDGKKSERLQQFGELVLASQHTIEKGDKSARVIDYYDPEMPEIEIPLDEKMTPRENAERLFQRARKTREASALAVNRIDGVRDELATLQSALETLSRATTVDGVKSLRPSLTKQNLLRAEQVHAVPGKREESEFGSAKIRRLTSSDGFEILYGENSTSNDFLTTKVAKPNDLWLHARQITGAHVVIRTNNRPDAVPPGTIREAAMVAAKNCDAKHSSLVPVDYTLRKHVRKPRAAAPGLVTYQREKTVDVSPKL